MEKPDIANGLIRTTQWLVLEDECSRSGLGRFSNNYQWLQAERKRCSAKGLTAEVLIHDKVEGAVFTRNPNEKELPSVHLQ